MGLWEVSAEIQKSQDLDGVSPKDVNQMVVDEVADLVTNDLVQIGMLTEDGGFAPWPQAGLEALRRLREELTWLPHVVNMPDPYWLNISDLGADLARSLCHDRPDSKPDQ